MDEVLRFLKTYEALIYLGLAGLALWEIRKFLMAWEETRGAAFGLERESAQGRLNKSAIVLILYLALGMGEFFMVSFVAPTVPGAIPLHTPTIDLLATPTVTLAPSGPGAEEIEPATPTPAGWPPEESGCIPEQLMLTSPQHGQHVHGRVTLTGTVDMPNLSFYKYEVMRPMDPIWYTLQAAREVKQDEALGDWDTQLLSPGEYLLRLVAVDNQGQVMGSCEISVQITANPGP
jgi:hypothetical protein